MPSLSHGQTHKTKCVVNGVIEVRTSVEPSLCRLGIYF